MKNLQVLLLLMAISVSMAIELTELYNSEVTLAEYYTRRLMSSSKKGGKNGVKKGVSGQKGVNTWWKKCRLVHAGVVVTITDGSRWLIHKGKDFGSTWDTVITDASHMSQAWTREKCGYVSGKTVDDFMKAGKIDCEYNLLTCNCQHAANGMWSLVDEYRCYLG